ncbi:MAG: hypothetical protein ACRDS9_02605 [Pseudonocardiaceae bacterium]
MSSESTETEGTETESRAMRKTMSSTVKENTGKAPRATRVLLVIYSALAFLTADVLWPPGGGSVVLQLGAVILALVAVANLVITPLYGRFRERLRTPIMLLHGVVGIAAVLVVFSLPPLAIIPVLLLAILSTAILCLVTGQASPQLKKLLVTTHVVFSVGWIGISAVMFSFALIALNSTNIETIRTLYHGMSILDTTVIGCAMIGAIFTGTLLSSATKWGYFKYWWVVAKIVLTALVLAAAFGALHGLILDALATARQPIAAGQAPQRGSSATLVMAGFALTSLSLIAAEVIAEFKPWGKTKHGQRDAERKAAARSAQRRSARESSRARTASSV